MILSGGTHQAIGQARVGRRSRRWQGRRSHMLFIVHSLWARNKRLSERLMNLPKWQGGGGSAISRSGVALAIGGAAPARTGRRKARENRGWHKSGGVWRGNCHSQLARFTSCTNLAADRRHCGSGRRDMRDTRIDNGR